MFNHEGNLELWPKCLISVLSKMKNKNDQVISHGIKLALIYSNKVLSWFQFNFENLCQILWNSCCAVMASPLRPRLVYFFRDICQSFQIKSQESRKVIIFSILSIFLNSKIEYMNIIKFQFCSIIYIYIYIKIRSDQKVSGLVL